MSRSTPFLLRAWDKLLGRESNVTMSYGGLKQLSTEHERIHTGNAWLHSEPHYNVASGSSVDHLIVPTSGGAVDLHLSHVGYNTAAGPAEINIYEAPFTDADSFGTDVTSSFENRNRTKTNARGFTIRENPFINVNSLGERLDYDLIEATAGGPVKTSGGAAGALKEAVLDNTKQYLMRFTNLSGDVSSYVSVNQFIYRADT